MQSAAPSQFSEMQQLHPVQPGYVRGQPAMPIAGIHSLFLWPLVRRGPQSHSQAPSGSTGDQRQSPTPALWVQAPVSTQLKTQGQPLGTEPTFSIHTTHQTTSIHGMFLWSMFCKKCESARSLLTKTKKYSLATQKSYRCYFGRDQARSWAQSHCALVIVSYLKIGFPSTTAGCKTF